MADQLIPEGPVYPDICAYNPTEAERNGVQALLGGFPCQVVWCSIVNAILILCSRGFDIPWLCRDMFAVESQSLQLRMCAEQESSMGWEVLALA